MKESIILVLLGVVVSWSQTLSYISIMNTNRGFYTGHFHLPNLSPILSFPPACTQGTSGMTGPETPPTF